MKKTSETIVFFGSGPVAADSLAVLADNFEIEAIITKQSPAHHHGSVPVKDLAQKLKLPLYFANSRGELDKLIEELKHKSLVGVIVDYGVIVSRLVIDAFPLGIINSHFSLLPQWRGADPITFTVLSGQSETGVSLMLIVEKLDEGPLLSQEKIEVPATITTPKLTEILVELSNKMLIRDIPLYSKGKLKPVDQPKTAPSYSRMLTKADGVLDWQKPAEQLEREIRAFIEWPKSRTKLGDLEVIITQAHSVPSSGRTGDIEIVSPPEGILIIYCGEGCLCIDRIKPIGKKEMTASDFILGYGARIGSRAG